jgi:hypothetical protein
MNLSTNPLLTKRALAAALVVALEALLLAACGGAAHDDEPTQLRLINATLDLDAIDLTTESKPGDETGRHSAVARDAQSAFVPIAAATYTLRGKRSDSGAAVALEVQRLLEGKHHTALVFGRSGNYQLRTLTEDQAEPAAGKALLRVFHAAPDAGDVDVYLIRDDASVDNTRPFAAKLAPTTISDYSALDWGTWRLRVTGRGNPHDLRLDLTAFELADKARTTIVLQSGRGGVLVHALVSQYHGTLAAVKNPHARVRLAAGAANNAAVSASVGGVTLNRDLRSPAIGSYALVPAGQALVSVTVDGVAATRLTRPLLAGGDHTLAVVGTPRESDWRLLPDRNLLPLHADKAQLRLVHMAQELDSSLTLTKDAVAVATDWYLANPDLYAPVPAGVARLEVLSPLFSDPLFVSDNTMIAAGGVYTVFVMTGTPRPSGLLQRER